MKIVKNQVIEDKKLKPEKQTKQIVLFSLVVAAVLENIRHQQKNRNKTD